MLWIPRVPNQMKIGIACFTIGLIPLLIAIIGLALRAC